ncbi:uncharacterized protein K441DRAFT_578598, partial [Cenococcum geophilum 1.58]|uniref:uncharacterized protein n=1 Tax=Cenococcum geophilum 1.58 TaxID=794803 RepID=UPI00358FD209
FCDTHIPKRGEGIKNDRLIIYHWFLLKKLSSVLQPFYKATIYSQGYKYTLYRWFTTIDWLFNRTFNAQIDFKELQL